MKKTLVILLVALMALTLIVGCKKEPKVKEPTNADYFLESYNAADFILNDFTAGVWNYVEASSTSSGFYPMNYYYSATGTTDPLMSWDGSKFLNLFTNEAKTKRVGIKQFTNYKEYSEDKNGTVNGKVSNAYQTVSADGINLEFKYKDQTSSDGATWTDTGDEKTGYLLCNAKRTKEAVEGSTTKFKYTVTDIKLSVKTVDGEWLDVSSKDEVEYKSISYVMDGKDITTLESLTFDGKALTADEIKAVINALNK